MNDNQKYLDELTDKQRIKLENCLSECLFDGKDVKIDKNEFGLFELSVDGDHYCFLNDFICKNTMKT